VSCSVVVEEIHVKPTKKKKKVQRNQNIFIVVSFLVLSVFIANCNMCSQIYFYQFLHFPEAHGYDLDYA
jgi:preprotein translocase subunit Sec63